MSNRLTKRNINWRKVGEAPDYRFSLANERTYLAWIRTALALLAGAVALDQFTPDLGNLLIRHFLSAFLCLCSGVLSIFAYRRWASNEASMRNKEELNYTSFIQIMSVLICLFSLIVIVVIFL
ncbi:YidH family protein [Psychromonas sp. L1A2]|uniref:YidH family protein n=1 Tax=Psychromonas sp. L1A2 TaxID=2686356 RepID=UPI003FA74F8C